MIPINFTTQTMRPLDQLQSWQEWFSPMFDISPIAQVGDEFFARNKVWSLGNVMISRVVAPSVHVKRRKLNIAKASADHWVLTYCRQGATEVHTPKGEFTAAGGVPFLWSLGEEFESKRTRVDRFQIMISREALSSLTSLLEASRGSALATPWGSLLGDYIIAVERSLPSMRQSDIPRLAAIGTQYDSCMYCNFGGARDVGARGDRGLSSGTRLSDDSDAFAITATATRHTVPTPRHFPIPALSPV